MATVNRPPLNFEKVCRTCLQVKKDMRPLFEQLTATMLMDISKVQVAVGDGLPPQLCLQCVHQISRCHAFKEQVERNDATLRQQALKMAEEASKNDNKTLNQDHNYMYLELSNPNPILDGFFNTEAPVESTETVPLTEITKTEFEDQAAAAAAAAAAAGAGGGGGGGGGGGEAEGADDDSYIQMVVLRATSSISPGRHVCNLCQKEFKHARWLKLHMQFHANWIKANCKKPPMCPICNRSFKGPGMLKMHMRTHEARPTKQPTCSVCQRVFPTKTLLYRHRQTHFEQKTHQCTVCEKRFFSAYALRSHMARHRGERPYVCSVCTKCFYNPTDLKVHFRLHTGEKPLKCSECHKTFRRHSTLCQHMKKHRGIRNHICSVCNKAFYEISKLNAHMRVHTGERPFECQFCARKFAQQSALIYHRRTHTGEKPFCCKLCPARFTTSSARNHHVDAHAGGKRFNCHVCNKGCQSRGELRAHIARHAAAGPAGGAGAKKADKYFCNLCSKGFSEINTYKKHMKLTHGHGKLEVQSENSSESQQSGATLKSDSNQEEVISENSNAVEKKTENQPDANNRKRYKCGLCVKTYMYIHSLKKHMLTHSGNGNVTQLQQSQSAGTGNGATSEAAGVAQAAPAPAPVPAAAPAPPALSAPAHQQIHLQQLQVANVVPLHQLQQPLTVQSGQHTYPVISSVSSLQLQQQTQQVNANPQQLQVQTIQIHPQQHPIQIQAVGVHQVQQQQLHVATSSCQSMLPNILQLQPAVGGVGTLGQQELGGVAHRIILQAPQSAHPALYAIHH